MNTMTETKENCRKQTGNLKINNKLYPVYEGLNIIGRDAKSTIILKETIFSKLHAAISVVDVNTHLICDLNSSNGTQLGKLKLIPYKFYSINDHEPIIFGDVVGIYFKGTELQNNCVVKISSQNVDHDASTQILNHLNNTVENIHDLPTQPFVSGDELNIHEAPTQLFSETSGKTQHFNIHEASTQIFPETNTIKNIHEADTQFLPDTSNIHEAETQFLPETNKPEDVHEAPTLYLKPDDDPTSKENTSNYNINDSDDDATQDNLDSIPTEEAPKIIETHPEEAPKTIETHPEEVPSTQNDNEDILSHTDVYDDIFANESFRSCLEKSSAEIEALEVDETVLVESQKNPNVEQFKKPETPATNDNEMSDDDDIILSTQDSEAIDQKYREHQQELNSTRDKVTEDVCDSDATDVEDEQLLIVNVEKLRDTSEVPATPEFPEHVNEIVIENHANDVASDEEEIDLLASTTSKSDCNTEESVRSDESLTKEAELPPAQLLTTTTTTSKEAINKSDDETDDELPATQLILLNPNKNSIEKDDVFLAPTQLIPKSPEKTSKTTDEIYLAATQKLTVDDGKSIIEPLGVNEEVEEIPVIPKSDENKTDEDATQMLPPEVSETNIINKEDNIYSAATQLLPPENPEDDEFEAATQVLSLETETTKLIEPSKNQHENDEENIFSVPTQILPVSNNNPEIIKSKETLVKNEEENIFSAATQILPVSNEMQDNPEATEKKMIENEEEPIFSAPTQLLLCPDDDIFLAPTQVLLEDDEPLKKNSGSVRLSSESNDDSMRLHLSETEPSLSNLNQDHQHHQEQEQQQQQNTETQLEVSFELETQKLYIEEKTRRPDNPLSHLFAEEATEMTEQYSETVNNGGGDKNEDLNISIENTMKLMPIVSVVDIKKSKITLKDIQEASTSKIKKSYVKLERIRPEPTRRSNRNAKAEPDAEEAKFEIPENVKTTKRKTKVSSNESSTSKVDKPTTNEETVAKEEKTTRRRTKLASNDTSTSRLLEKQDEATNKENGVLKEATDGKPVKEEIKEKQVMKEKEEVRKNEEEENNRTTTKTKLLKGTQESLEYSENSENSEETENKMNSSRHNTRGKRRDYKSIVKGEVENENVTKGRITSKSFVREKIEELEIHVKEETLKRRAAKSSIEEPDSDDSVFKSKRSRRNNSKEPEKEKKTTITVEDTDDSSIEINIRKKVARIEDSQESETRPKRNAKRTAASEEIKETTSGRNKRVARNTKQTSKAKEQDNEKLAIDIEDSDESILETCKKEAKMMIPSEAAMKLMSSEESGRQTRRRNSQISPERNKRMPPGDICLNTPNSKRRKYEPLSVNISSSQFELNNDATAEHKVVFTMLNDHNLENIVRKLGGSVVDSIHACTVLVTNKISRSLKFLIAIALGKPIVHLKWIIDSEKRRKFLDPWDYLLEDAESEAKFQMSLKESLNTSRNKKLMTGETILLAAAKNFEVLKEIIETSGGKCITRAPPKNSKTVVVCYEDEKSKYSRYLKQKTLIVVSAEAIFSGVLQQKLNWKQYVLS